MPAASSRPPSRHANPDPAELEFAKCKAERETDRFAAEALSELCGVLNTNGGARSSVPLIDRFKPHFVDQGTGLEAEACFDSI
jgi:hypothetical protein